MAHILAKYSTFVTMADLKYVIVKADYQLLLETGEQYQEDIDCVLKFVWEVGEHKFESKI